MKKNANLLYPLVYISLGCCVAMTIASLFFNLRLFYIFAGVTVFCAVLIFWQLHVVKKSINSFLLRMGQTLTTAQQEALIHFPIPVFVCDEHGEIIWYNRLAQVNVLDGENGYGSNMNLLIEGVDVTRTCPESGYEVPYKNRHFSAYVAEVAATEGDSDLYVVYFFDNTELKKYAQEYFETRPFIMYILVDNYEELQQVLKDNERTRAMGQIEYEVGKYISECGGLLLRTDRDRFTVVIEDRYLRKMISSRFPLLEQVRGLQNEAHQPATLSIGVGGDAANLSESEQYARQALDMALGRGGDQAVVRGSSGYEFFGGVSGGVEKHTKVKTRIVATALAELISGSDNVLVMGHQNADLDCFGASVGVLRAAIQMGKEAHLVVRRQRNLAGSLYDRLWSNGFEGLFVEPEMAMQLIMRKTLLIICDTHVPQILESRQVYEACKSVVVIDHHRKMVGHIDNAVIFYHEPYASSASEMVTELVQYFGERLRIGRPEAEALLAGIMLDTKNFVIKTGVRTFEAAAYLRKMGADTVEVRRLFATTIESYQQRAALVANASVYRGCAIATCDEPDRKDIQVTAAQAADELLNISGVLASFLIFATATGVSYSARSMGQLNVQIVMEKLGGGGHLTMAGAQTPDITVQEAYDRLIKAVDEFFTENERK